MKYLKFNESFAPQLGMEYSVANYPETGIYFANGFYVLVNKETSLVFGLGNSINLTEYIEPTLQQSIMTEAFILKALAVAQDPSLIREVI